jgi:hypothetical protein
MSWTFSIVQPKKKKNKKNRTIENGVLPGFLKKGAAKYLHKSLTLKPFRYNFM